MLRTGADQRFILAGLAFVEWTLDKKATRA